MSDNIAVQADRAAYRLKMLDADSISLAQINKILKQETKLDCTSRLFVTALIRGLLK